MNRQPAVVGIGGWLRGWLRGWLYAPWRGKIFFQAFDRGIGRFWSDSPANKKVF